MIKILLPCDGSSNSLHSVRHVIRDILRNPTLELLLLNVQPPFSKRIGWFTREHDRSAVHREQSHNALRPGRQLLDNAGIPYTVHTAVGDKAQCIASAADRLRCHRIVMSTRPKTALQRLLGQSVTRQVVERSRVAVEVIAGSKPSKLESIGIPAGFGTGALLLWLAAAD